eukprot:g5490.t1
MVHSGTPTGVPASADCAIRKFAWERGQGMMPARGAFKSLYDALQLGACNVTAPKEADIWQPPVLATVSATRALLVDARAPLEAACDGSPARPFRTLADAVTHSRSLPKPLRIELRAGVHLLEATIELGAQDSGLTIANHAGEAATLSGGRNLTGLSWAPSPACGAGCFEADLSSLSGGAFDVPGLRVDGVREIRARHPNNDPELDAVIDGEHLVHDGRMGWVTDKTQWVAQGQDMNGVPGAWPPAGEAATYVIGAADWPEVEWPEAIMVDGKPAPNSWTGEGDWGQFWLGVNGTCVDRSPPAGYWCAPGAPRHISTPNHPGGITSPRSYANPAGAVVHAWRPGHWYTNMFEVRGAKTVNHSDVWSYYANVNNVKGRCISPTSCEQGVEPLGKFDTLQGCQAAVGLNSTRSAKYTSYTYHQLDFGGNFAGYCFGVTDGQWLFSQQAKIDSGRAPFVEQELEFGRGGFQGGEGVTDGEAWYIENVFEELDSPREWFFNSSTRKLYYWPNGTSAGAGASAGPAGDFVATNLKELIRVVGTQAQPAHHIAIAGLTLRDTAYTYMDEHGLPSGGDWALQKQGAITLVGTENVTVEKNLFTRLDGNGIFIGGYNRGLSVTDNEFVFIGDSAMAAWGDTGTALNQNKSLTVPYPLGPDGRGGNQPRGCQIKRNLVHEIGLWQKQSSLWFQAVTAQTQLQDNIFFNGPRAAFNFNDGFGGGDDISGNLLLNTCRESSDHGPWNSWDRVPYITTLRTGKPSIVPADRKIHHNFIIGTYNSQETIDTDDGSAYIQVYNNFLAFADNGLKSDFGGHDEVYFNNTLAYVGACWDMWNFDGYNDGFWDNACVFRNSYASDCFGKGKGLGWRVGNNSVFSESGNENICSTTLSQWVKQGHDQGTTISKWPTDDALVAMGKRTLAM